MFILIMTLIMLTLSSMMLFMNFILSKKSQYIREKSSPFECGFDPMSNSRIPFSIQFFIISLIFLIFDVEITILIPLMYLFTHMNKIMLMTSMLFMMMLIIGLLLEYLEKSIDWKN
uniref:NADH-ubiquinone oxidoreductase chain 3 n=2 Tax=Dolichoderus TaxID=121500 RepID=A0A451FR83_9HYME|nr:NADH dehydrogenase subunit 3 [Dolichoderus sibiricus]YP_009868544.1 NADH dehydrogenase subunit 3 [Dolichoderus quadripunctatus]QAA79738.1 NADH dehydrogenase subunit 3 [Dolichoderus sibiricus]QKG63378.1 NADH dehydrogenase subunit 3 [Dolichoderus quadripunctatus]UEC47358.1 NADH dehydrogenase subunit 3 [Dolichoderus sibiricus]